MDDGAASLEEALAGLERMHQQGFRNVTTTPHFRASTLKHPEAFEDEMGRIDEAWDRLQTAAKTQFPDIHLSRGVELALDEPIDSADDPRVRLGGSRFMLVEFPYFTIPPNSGQALLRLRRAGVTPIVAHPERYGNLENDLKTLYEWKRSGAFLQLNAGSIVGAYGSRIERTAWRCLRAGLVDYLCSDYHSRGNCLTDQARTVLIERGGNAQFTSLAQLNGRRLLEGLEPTPVEPFGRTESRWTRLINRVRRRP